MPTLNLLSFNIYGSGDNVHITNQGNDVYVAVDATGTTAINTGNLTGEFYPRFANPKGYITQTWLNGLASSGDILLASGSLQNQIDNLNIVPIDTGNFATSDDLNIVEVDILDLKNWTGISPSLFYPLGSNPSNYSTVSQLNNLSTTLQGVDANQQGQINNINSNTGNWVLKFQTGQFVTNNQILNLVNKSETGSFVTSNQISSLSPISYVNSVSGNLQGQINSIPSINTGSLVNTFYPLNTNPSNYATITYVNNVSGVLASQVGGSGSQVKVTGSNVIAVPNIIGIGSTKIILSGSSILISGNPSGVVPSGNFAQVVSGNVTMVGGTTISNGELLIGNAADNSFTQGKVNAGSGISISSGAGSLTISCTVAPTQQVTQGNGLLEIRTIGSNYTVTTGDLVFNPITFVYTGNASGTITLPAANLTSGKVIICKQGGLGNLVISSASQIYTTGNSFNVLLVSGDCLAFHSSSSKYWAH